MKKLTKHAKRILIDIAGLGCIAIGLVLSPFPGPWSIPMYIVGLSLLAQNYEWAHRLMTYLEKQSGKIIPEKYKKYTIHLTIGGFLIGAILSSIIYVSFIR